MSETNFSPVMLILLAALVLAIAFGVWMYIQKRRTQKLRSRFGPEYDRAVGDFRDRAHAESDLEKREKRVARFNIHPLNADERSGFAESWRREQSLFVDDPRAAVSHADTLVQDEMKRRRGLSSSLSENFEQNATDLLGGSSVGRGKLSHCA